jgi:hypothetical protein
MTPAEKLFAASSSIRMIARREGRHQRELARLAGEVRDVAETPEAYRRRDCPEARGGRK